MRMSEGVTGVRLKLDDMFRAFEVATDLRDRLGGSIA
jgi:ABC-type lipoprotein release transport system permease subunit